MRPDREQLTDQLMDSALLSLPAYRDLLERIPYEDTEARTSVLAQIAVCEAIIAGEIK